MVGLWGFDGGCVGFWVCSRWCERERDKQKREERERLLLQIYILLCGYIILMY